LVPFFSRRTNSCHFHLPRPRLTLKLCKVMTSSSLMYVIITMQIQDTLKPVIKPSWLWNIRGKRGSIGRPCTTDTPAFSRTVFGALKRLVHRSMDQAFPDLPNEPLLQPRSLRNLVAFLKRTGIPRIFYVDVGRLITHIGSAALHPELLFSPKLNFFFCLLLSDRRTGGPCAGFLRSIGLSGDKGS